MPVHRQFLNRELLPVGSRVSVHDRLYCICIQNLSLSDVCCGLVNNVIKLLRFIYTEQK